MIDLLLSLYRLKEEPRTGWRLRGVGDPESVADHSWGTALLCLIFGPAAGVDGCRAQSLALVHDLAEAVTGDRPARFDAEGRKLPDEEKGRAERRAVERLFPVESGELRPLRELWQEYELRESPEAAFVRDMNLVDMCIQAVIYESEAFDGERAAKGGGTAGRLAEFLESTAGRLTTSVGRELFAQISARFRAIHDPETPTENGRREQ